MSTLNLALLFKGDMITWVKLVKLVQLTFELGWDLSHDGT